MDRNDATAQKSPITNNDLLELDTIIVPIGKTIGRVRAIILGGITVAFLFRIKTDLFFYNPSVVLFAFLLYLFCSILFLFVTTKNMSEKHSTWFRISQLVLDLAFTTLLIYFSGDVHSRLAFLYIIPVISAANISSVVLFITTAISLMLYYGLIYLVDFGFIKSWNSPFPTVDYFSDMQLLRHGLTVLVIAFAANFYIQNIKKQNEKLNKLKEEFMFIVLHDVRSPIVSIKWLIEKYRKPEFIQRYPDIQDDLRAVEELTSRVINISESMLLLAKNQKIPVTVKSLDIIPIIKSVLQEEEPGIVQKHILAEYNPPKSLPSVSANDDFLKEALINIIGNAIKYNRDGGKLVVGHEIEGSFLKTTILNTGPKIEAENIRRLFNPYYRGSMENKIAGTGLGLYVTRKIIEKMGGSIGVESSTDEETVFYILLPLANTDNTKL